MPGAPAEKDADACFWPSEENNEAMEQRKTTRPRGVFCRRKPDAGFGRPGGSGLGNPGPGGAGPGNLDHGGPGFGDPGLKLPADDHPGYEMPGLDGFGGPGSGGSSGGILG